MPGVASTTCAPLPAADGTPILVRRWAAAGEPWARGPHRPRPRRALRAVRARRSAGWLRPGSTSRRTTCAGSVARAGRRAWVDRWSRNPRRPRGAARRGPAGGRRPAGRPVRAFAWRPRSRSATSSPTRRDRRPTLLVLSAPAIDSTSPGWKQRLAPVLGRVAPTMRSRTRFDGTILSRDPSVGERYLADPLNYHSTTTRLGADAIAEQARVRAALDRLRSRRSSTTASDDRLVPTATSEPFADLPGVTRRTYPGLRHESHNEPEGAGRHRRRDRLAARRSRSEAVSRC